MTIRCMLLLSLLALSSTQADWPKSWQPNNWSGFLPLAKHELQGDVLHIYDVTAEAGFGWYSSNHQPAVAGDEMVIKAKIKGKGKIRFQVQYLDAEKLWLGFGKHDEQTMLTENWQNKQFRIPIGNLTKGVTAAARVTFAGTKDTELYISEVKCEVAKGNYAGDVSFPRHWTVFAPVDAELTAPVGQLPTQLAGKQPMNMTLNLNLLDFREVFPEHRKRNCAWLYAEFEADHEQDYTFGAGADYFLAVYLNGKLVIDTRKTGNDQYPPHFTDHVTTAKLQKGKNLLAIQFLTGSSSKPVVSLGGAQELRELKSAVSVTSITEQDTFTDQRVRAGNPELVDDILVDGMETMQRFGRYRSGSQISLPNSQNLVLPAKSGDYLFATGIRLQKLTGVGDFTMRLGDDYDLQLTRAANSEFIRVAFRQRQQPLKHLEISETSLPVDLIMAVSHREYFVNLTSIQDSRLHALHGQEDFSRLGQFSTNIALAGVEATVKNYFIGAAQRDLKSNTVPFLVDLSPTFDPREAGWKLIWQDEFEGTEVDWENTWMNTPYNPPPRNRDMAFIRDGRLHIRCEWTHTPEGKRQYTGRTVGMYSQQRFRFGYFEAKVRFTRKPGWWAAFWMQDEGRNMALGGGYEIDIFEDYSTRGGEPNIANNLHVTFGPNMRSYGYHFKLPGSLDDFYVIGCKWTPFEVSTYVNGQLASTRAQHSPYQSATYDAINHAFGNTSLYISLSGQAGQSGGLAKEEGSEEYIVEYVRAYEYPRDKDPTLQLLQVPTSSVVRTGDKVSFTAAVAPSPVTGAAIQTVFLFDNGNLIDYRSEAPYQFTIPMTPEFFQGTAWGSSGRSGQKALWDSYPHCFVVAVQDEQGKVAISETVPIIVDYQPGEPFQGKAQVVPGIIATAEYNRGGHNVSCYKQLRGGMETGKEDVFSRKSLNLRESGEWVNYTIDVQASGNYQLALNRREYRREWPASGIILLNGVMVGKLQAEPHEAQAVLKNLNLTAGKHVLTLMTTCTYGLWPENMAINKMEK